MDKLREALNAVGVTYGEIKGFIDETVVIYLNEVDNIIKRLEDNLFELSNEDVRNAIVELSLKSYRLSDIKEKAALKAECAETIRKSSYANAFNASAGSVAVRENEASNNTINEVLAEKVYDAIASTMKTKLDEIHRVVDALKSVLVSRLSEEKLAQNQVAQ